VYGLEVYYNKQLLTCAYLGNNAIAILEQLISTASLIREIPGDIHFVIY
jgi:hypothetical protein